MAVLDFVSYNSVDVTLEKSVYIFESPDSNTDYTYNLPNITSDGMRFMFSRIDADTSSTLTISSISNTIFNGSTSVTSVLLYPRRKISLLSKSDIWYIITTKSVQSIPRTLSSGAFISTNGREYKRFSGDTTNEIVSTIFYPGRDIYIMSYFVVVIDVVRGPFDIAMYLIRPDGTPVTSTVTRQITSDPSGIPQNYIVTGPDIYNDLIATGNGYLRMVINATGSRRQRVLVYSFLIK
jgi:hypothetical protein